MKIQISWILSVFLFLNAASQDLHHLAPTPPMGWNSWDCFGMDVTEDQMKATANYMAKNLKSYGWNYIALDMGWNYGDSLNTSNFRKKNPTQILDGFGLLIPNIHKFPSASGGKGLKSLADYVHSVGLKFGIHIMRGIPWQAIQNNMPVKGTKYLAKDIATDKDTCRWFHGMVSIEMTKPGSQEYYDSLIDMYAEWGVDYIKADDLLKDPYQNLEIEAIRKAIKKIGKPIVLSLSAGPLPVEKIEHLRQNANLWRISGDTWDDWSYIKKTFDYCRLWQDYVISNHWPDYDILPLGKLMINGTDGALAKAIKKQPEETINEFARLTNDEKYTMMTLWSIFRSPLMIGGNLLEMDKLTMELLTNKEVLAVNQNSINNREIKAKGNETIWIADDPISQAKYVALFNVSDDQSIPIRVYWNELGIMGKYQVRDIWQKKDIGSYKSHFETLVNPHGCGLYKIYPGI